MLISRTIQRPVVVRLEKEKLWKEGALVQIEVGLAYRHLPRRTEDNYEKSVTVVGVPVMMVVMVKIK